MIRTDKLPGQLPDETLVGLYRRHPITIFGIMAAFAVVLLLPIGAFIGLKLLEWQPTQHPNVTTIIVLGGSVFLLFCLLFIYQQFLDYWLDMWIMTNRRIINIEQRGLFSRTVSELRLYRVQDVTAEINGFAHSMLDFGVVYIQTAGEKEYFAFEDVPHPNQIAKDILALAEKDREEHLELAMEAMEETTVEHHDAIRQNAAPHLEP